MKLTVKVMVGMSAKVTAKMTAVEIFKRTVNLISDRWHSGLRHQSERARRMEVEDGGSTPRRAKKFFPM